jgi:Disulphide bond corrector protein DsbC
MKSIFLVILTVFSTIIFAQKSPVSWTFQAEKINEKEYNLIATATIGDNWNIYSQYLKSDDGPVRTSFTYDEPKEIELAGMNIEDGHKKEGFDPVFEMEVIKFTEKVTFTQKIKLKSNVSNVKGKVNFMCCDNEICLPPSDVVFDIKL